MSGGPIGPIQQATTAAADVSLACQSVSLIGIGRGGRETARAGNSRDRRAA